jgi:hypothetical protein
VAIAGNWLLVVIKGVADGRSVVPQLNADRPPGWRVYRALLLREKVLPD